MNAYKQALDYLLQLHGALEDDYNSRLQTGKGTFSDTEIKDSVEGMCDLSSRILKAIGIIPSSAPSTPLKTEVKKVESKVVCPTPTPVIVPTNVCPMIDTATSVVVPLPEAGGEPFIEVKQPFSYKTDDVVDRRRGIREESGLSAYPEVTAENFLTLFVLYDKYFFGDTAAISLANAGDTLVIETSVRMTSSGGMLEWKTSDKPRTFKLKLSLPIFNGITPTTIKNHPVEANGIKVNDRLDAMQIVLEHELIHLLIAVPTNGKLESAHGNLFATMVRNIFNHTKMTHALNPIKAAERKQKAEAMMAERKAVESGLTKADFKIGDRIKFYDAGTTKGRNQHAGGWYFGTLTSLGPKNGIGSSEGTNKSGSGMRFKVPYGMLHHVD